MFGSSNEEADAGSETEGNGETTSDVYGCLRNVNNCGRKASNYNPLATLSAAEGEPGACIFDGPPDCNRCPDEPECEGVTTAADVRLNRDGNKGCTEYGDLTTVFSFSGKA